MGLSRHSSRSARATLDLVGAIYDAALTPEAFPAVLERIAAAVGARSAAFMVEDRARHQLVSGSLLAITEAHMIEYARDWMALDDGFQRILPRLPAGAVATDRDVKDFERTEIYDGWFRRMGMERIMAACPVNDGSLLGIAAFHRRRSKGAFDEDDVGFFQRLVPHLARTAAVQRQLLDAAARRQVSLDVLDRIATGVVMLDPAGRVLLMNRAAREIVDGNDGLSVGRDGLRAALARETAELRRLTCAAASTAEGNGTDAGGAISVSRPSMRRPLSILVSPLRMERPLVWSERPAAVVFVSDPERAPEPPQSAFQRVWGLSPSQARVCAELVAGRGMREVAGRLGISYETARTHLKHALARTGARRQAELVTLLLSAPAGWLQP